VSRYTSDPEQYDDSVVGYSCRRCKERVVSLDESGRCYDGCEAPGAEELQAKQREAHIRHEKQTAAYLRGLGFHARAEVHERAAEGK
jgi:hypothetical protein